MTGDGELTTVTDNTDNFSSPLSACPRERRTVFIRIQRRIDKLLEFHMWGPELSDIGSIPFICVLDVNQAVINDWIAEMNRVWMENLISWHDAAAWRERRYGKFPMAEQIDLRSSIEPVDLDRMWRALARAGHELFKLLFFGPDDSLREIGSRLTSVLRAAPQAITIISNDVVVPWSMLYTPPDPADELSGDFDVELSGFWGYKHLVEHRFDTPTRNVVDIRYRKLIRAGTYIDATITDGRGEPLASSAVSLLRRRTAEGLGEMTLPDELRSELEGPARRRHLLYFFCHCVSDTRGKPALRLSRDPIVSTANVDSWLRGGQLHANPLVFINSCEATQLENSPHHFARTLLDKGASCLIGPYVSVPRPFARRFALGLLCHVLHPRRRLGAAVRSVSAFYADRFRNPLGFAYTVYHGMDSHFCPRLESDTEE